MKATSFSSDDEDEDNTLMKPASSKIAFGSYVTSLEKYDVLLGRGNPSVTNPGNIRLRHMAEDKKNAYKKAARRFDKEMIIRELVTEVKAKGGRFLQRVESLVEAEELGVPAGKPAWKEVDDSLAQKKVRETVRGRRLPLPRLDDFEEGDQSLGESGGIPRVPTMQDYFGSSSPADRGVGHSVRQALENNLRQSLGSVSSSQSSHSVPRGQVRLDELLIRDDRAVLPYSAAATALSEASERAQKNIGAIDHHHLNLTNSVPKDPPLHSKASPANRQRQLLELRGLLQERESQGISAGLHQLIRPSDLIRRTSALNKLEDKSAKAAKSSLAGGFPLIQAPNPLQHALLRDPLSLLRSESGSSMGGMQLGTTSSSTQEDMTSGHLTIILSKLRFQAFSDDSGDSSLPNTTISLAEAQLLRVLCSHGIPIALTTSSLQEILFESTGSAQIPRFKMQWSDIGRYFVDEAIYQRSLRPSQGDMAVETAVRLSTNTRDLAVRTVALLEKLRVLGYERSLYASTGDSSTGEHSNISRTLDTEILRWAFSLGCINDNTQRPLCFSSEDLRRDSQGVNNPIHQPVGSLDVLSCQTIYRQIAHLTRLRGMALRNTVTSPQATESSVSSLYHLVRQVSTQIPPSYAELLLNPTTVRALQVVLEHGYQLGHRVLASEMSPEEAMLFKPKTFQDRIEQSTIILHNHFIRKPGELSAARREGF